MAGLADFAATLQSDPNFAGAWGEIQAQLLTEQGLDPQALANEARQKGQDVTQVLQARGTPALNDAISRITSAKTAFVTSFSDLSSRGIAQFGDDPVAAAKSFVMAGSTISGAVSTIGSLVSTVEHGSPVEVVQAFTGTLLGAAVATGAVTAGVGAAVVGAVSIVLDLLSSAGLFSPPPEPVKDFTVGGYWAVAVNRQGDHDRTLAQVAPRSVDWRRFPEPSDPADRAFFTPIFYSQSSGEYEPMAYAQAHKQVWHNLYFGRTSGSPVTHTPVQGMFPDYDRAAQSAGAKAIGDSALGDSSRVPAELRAGSDFQKGFFSAWKANQAYALNGLKPQDDAACLVHFLNLWNASHAGDKQVTLDPGDATLAHRLVDAARHAGLPGATIRGQSLIVNVGARKGATIAPVVKALSQVHLQNNVTRVSNIVTQAKAASAGAAAAQAVIAQLHASLPVAPVTLPTLARAAPAKRPWLPALVGGGAGYLAYGPIGGIVGGGLGFLLGEV